MPRTMHVVSHTHWDREWYQTFQQFRLRLVDLIDHLLDILDADPDFRFFNLDAQTIVLEDYLQIRPHERERLERYIREGRITVGPWYQLNDEFLTSGEATVRSLLVGHRMATAFGACMKVGYLPDQFGNLGQMPQILQGFDIDNAIMGRGYQLVDDRKMEFVWEAPDGSRVAASLMAWWYNNAQYIPADPEMAVAFVDGLRDTMAPKSSIGDLLFMNGVDHLEAQPGIGKTICAVNSKLTERGESDRLVHSTLTDYVAALRAQLPDDAEVVRGELREDRGGACLAGTLSTRMYLKQANHKAQIALEQYAERLSAFAQLTDAANPYDQLHYAWKLLMQNHPHDSICGCSTDQVHREMMPRFDQVVQIADEMTARALDTLTGRSRTTGATDSARTIAVFNTLNWTRTDPVTITLEFPLGTLSRGNPQRDDSKMLRAFRLLDPSGAEVPYAVTKTETVVATVSNPHELPLDQWVQRIAVEFVATDLPACGYKAYAVVAADAQQLYANPEHGVGMSPLALFYEDCGDVGDEYLHRKPLVDATHSLHLARTPDAEDISGVRRTLVFSNEWRLPMATQSDMQSRSHESVRCGLATRLTKWVGVPRTEVETTFDNRARDHRLRVCFTTGAQLEPRNETISDAQFDAMRRPIAHPQEHLGASTFHPQQFWTAQEGVFEWQNALGESGEREVTMTIANHGLPEFEYIRERGIMGALAVTLLRCVGQLSARGDGPGIPTPDAQCQGTHTFRLARTHTDGCWRSEQIWKQAYQFNVPLVAVQCPTDAGRAAERSFLTVEPAELIVTAIKRAEDRESLIVRFFNITPFAAAGRVDMPGASRCRTVNLNEEPQEEWRSGSVFSMDVGPKKIVTVEFEA